MRPCTRRFWRKECKAEKEEARLYDVPDKFCREEGQNSPAGVCSTPESCEVAARDCPDVAALILYWKRLPSYSRTARRKERLVAFSV